MSQQPQDPNAVVLPQFTHYKLRGSDSVDDIYPAMKSPPGYEDAHPEDWQPATADEIVQYKANAAKQAASARYNGDGSTKVQGTGGIGAGGGSLQLAPEDPAPAPAAVPVAPAAIPVAVAIPAAPVEVAPPADAPAIDVGALGFGSSDQQ